jgi:hypothetical protein
MLLLNPRQQGLKQVHLTDTHRVQPEAGLLATPGGGLSKEPGSNSLAVFSLANGPEEQPGRCQQEQ